MNILVISSQLLGDNVDMSNQALIDDIHEIYLNGQFDRMVILHHSVIDVDAIFPFARCLTKIIDDNDNIIDKMISFLTTLTNTLPPKYLFTILCKSDIQAQEIIKSSKKSVPICFMEVDDAMPDTIDFKSFPQDDLWSTPDCHYFRSLMAQYKYTPYETTPSTRKINKFYRVNIHCIRKPSDNTISHQI